MIRCGQSVAAGWNALAGADAEKILRLARTAPPADRPRLFGDGCASERIAGILVEHGR